MRNRGHVFNQVDLQTGGLQSTDRGFTAGAGALHIHFHGLKAVFHRRAGGGFRRRLGGKRSRFPRTAEAELTGAGPRKSIALRVGDSNDSIVKRGLDMRGATFNILAFLAAAGYTLARSSFSSSDSSTSSYFFLLAMVFFGPLRVRALVLVR